MQLRDIKQGDHLARCARNRKQPRCVQFRRTAEAAKHYAAQAEALGLRASWCTPRLLAGRDER